MPDNYFFSPTTPIHDEAKSNVEVKTNSSDKYDNGRGGSKNDKFLTPWQQFDD